MSQVRSSAHVVDDRVFRLVLEMEMSKALRLQYMYSVLTIVREPARGPSTANGRSDADSIAAVVSRATQASDLIGLVPNAPAVRILLVDTHLDDLSGVIERVRAEFSPEVTLSFGAACFPTTGSTTAELLRRADLEAGLVPGG
jgi:GGDEF domain-containing protein